MNEDISLDLELSLSIADINEILGIEHSDTEELSENFIDKAVDEFVENNDKIPQKKKGLFSEIFKKNIKRRCNQTSDISEEPIEAELIYDLISYDDPTSLSEFNEIVSEVIPDAALDEEQVRLVENYLGECGITLKETENVQNPYFLEKNSTEGSKTDFSHQDDSIIEERPENAFLGQINESNFSTTDEIANLDDFFRSEPNTDAIKPSFLPTEEDLSKPESKNESDHFIPTQSGKLSTDDIEMVYPTEGSMIKAIERDKSCFISTADPSVSNTAIERIDETDPINKKIFDQIIAKSNDGGSFPMTYYDPEIRKYYIPETGSIAWTKEMEILMNGQRMPETAAHTDDPKQSDTPQQAEDGVYSKHSDSFRAVDFSSANKERVFGESDPAIKEDKDSPVPEGSPESKDSVDGSRYRYASNVASFRVNHGYEEYSETIGRIVSNNISTTTTDIESEVTKGAREFQNSDLCWWVKTILAPVGASSVREAIATDGKVSIDAAMQVEKYVVAGKLSINDLNIGSSDACQKIRDAKDVLVSERTDLKTELARTNALLQTEQDAKKTEDLKTQIDVLNAKIRNKEDEIAQNEKSLSEQICHDYNDLKVKLACIEKEKKVLKTEMATLSKDIRSLETRLNSGELTKEKRAVLQRKLDSTRQTLLQRQSLSEALGGSAPIRNRDILKRHKELYGKFTTREAMRGCKALSETEKSFVNSKTFFGNTDRKLYASAFQKHLRSKGVAYARDHDIAKLSSKDLDKFIKGGRRNGLTAMDIEALRALKTRNDHNRWIRRSDGSFYGPELSSGGRRRTTLAFRHVADRILRSDGIYGESYNRLRVKVNSARMTAKIARISSHLLRASYSTSLINKVNRRVVLSVKVRIKESSIARVIDDRKKIHSVERQKHREVRRQTYAELKNTLEKPAVFIRQKAREVRNSFENIKAVKSINSAKQKIKQGFGGVKRDFVNSVPVKKVKHAGKVTKDKLERSASFAGRVMAFLSSPLKAVAKIKNFLDMAKQKFLMLLGHVAILFIKFYIAFVLLVLIVNTVISLLGAITGYTEDTAKLMKEMQAKLINYPELSDMKSDVDWILDEDARRREEAISIGEGRPINPYVTNDRTVDRYGSPEHFPGYTLHFLDAYGNEMPSDSTNARDIICLATAMFSNEIGNIHGDWRDLGALDDLIADLYEMLSDQITYEESDIYFCMHGCEYYDYVCNDWNCYSKFNGFISNGAKKYENLVPYDSRGCQFDEEGYKSYYEECEEWYYDIKPKVSDYEYFDYEEWEWEFDEEAYEDAINEWADIDWEPDIDDFYYCSGHSTRICFGHKDIDIYITLYNLDYAIENRMYPANWESKSYADQIRRFMETGGWDNEMYVEWAHSYYDGDWYGIYGIDVEKGCGFSKGRPLSDEEIDAIIERIGSISEARKELVEFALSAVGKISYQYGGKATGSGMSARFGSSTPDEKGRTNGLDCSGFVQWVYRSALGVIVPGSTAGYSNYSRISHSSLQIGDIGFYEVPGSADNHMGIYLGVDEGGNETWVHCSGASGSTYGTGNFRYFVSVF